MMNEKEDSKSKPTSNNSPSSKADNPSKEDLSILSIAEIEVLKAMRSERYTNIEIKFRRQKPFLCVVTEEIKLQIEARLSHILRSGGNEKIEITTSQGSINHCLKITRILL